MDIAQITDSHCHLDFPDLAQDLPDVIARAETGGVHRMVSICTRLRNAPQVRALAERFDSVFWAVGTHPMSVAEEPMAQVAELVELAR
ncbi:MAG: TatD family hydrolase, partial [Pseudomonadota bacterium]